MNVPAATHLWGLVGVVFRVPRSSGLVLSVTESKIKGAFHTVHNGREEAARVVPAVPQSAREELFEQLVPSHKLVRQQRSARLKVIQKLFGVRHDFIVLGERLGGMFQKLFSLLPQRVKLGIVQCRLIGCERLRYGGFTEFLYGIRNMDVWVFNCH